MALKIVTWKQIAKSLARYHVQACRIVWLRQTHFLTA